LPGCTDSLSETLQVWIKPPFIVSHEQSDFPVSESVAAPSNLHRLDCRATIEQVDRVANEHLPLIGLPSISARGKGHFWKTAGSHPQRCPIDPKIDRFFPFDLIADPTKSLEVVEMIGASVITGVDMIHLKLPSVSVAAA
jgi:hypothetical protein